MKEVTLTIDGNKVTVAEGTSILEAAKMCDVDIPTLCYLKDINEIGACRMCLVEIKNVRALQAACVYPCADGIEVLTNSQRVRNARKVNLELILSNHNRECTLCIRSENCELQALSRELNISNIPYEGVKSGNRIDDLSLSIVRDDSKCILCKRCVAVCNNIQNVGVLGTTNRGFNSKVEPVFNKSLAEVSCINCGQCIINCPVGALKEKDSTQQVWNALSDKSKHVLVQTAPAVRAALGEEFGYEMGTGVTGKMVAALRKMGFDKVFDTDFAADVTIMEEGSELLDRIQNNGVLPMITSCSPGWIKYCEHKYPQLLPHLSSCKSPQNMMGALLKSHYAKTNGINPKDIIVVSVMPCTAKKFEIQREELKVDGVQDVDISITTRELARMIKEARIEFVKLKDEHFDEFYGDSTGAAVIFGTTGGVMEAALRTVSDLLTGKDVKEIEYTNVRGIKGVKEARIKITDDITVKVAVAHGGSNIKELLNKVESGECEYHFIEMMGCPGGCVNGGGQPIVSAKVKMEKDIRAERAKALYREDKNVLALRKSHENPSVIKLYEDYLEKPNSHKAHKLLHTTYKARSKY